MAREMAVNAGVCVRPVMKRVYDRDTGAETRIPIACGSTREAVCPPCARKARVLRMQQCQEGWHRDTEPDRPDQLDQADDDQADDDDQAEDESEGARGECGRRGGGRMRPTCLRCRWPTAPSAAPSPLLTARSTGRRMFLTLTLPSYGPIRSGTGVPVDPGVV